MTRLPGACAEPRLQLLRFGSGQLSDAELLAELLGGRGRARGAPVSDTLAVRLLREFGGLAGVLDASSARLLAIRGLGESRVAALKAVLGLAERYALAPMASGSPITGAASAEQFLRIRLGGREQEVFAALFLNARHQVLAFEELFTGSVDRACVYPREVLKRALGYNAAALVLAHNHPSGNPEPSASDVKLTERLKQLLSEIDVRLLDHLVIGRGGLVSLAERGLV